jgi:hypothetical protein
VAAGRVWPLVDVVADFTAGPPNTPGAGSVSLSSAGSVVREWANKRGRQYEMGVAEAGELDLPNLHDPVENLNPLNVSSPWNSGANLLLPYRCVRVHAWWNAAAGDVSGNLLANNNPIPGQPALANNYGYDPSFESWWVVQNPTSGTTIATSTTHPNGSFTTWRIIVATAGDNFSWLPRLVPGRTYTVTVDLWAVATAVEVGYQPGGGVAATTATTTTTGAWQNRSITFTATTVGNLYMRQTAGSFPATFYYSNLRTTGLVPGWSVTGGTTMGYTTAQAHAGDYALTATTTNGTDTASVPLWTAPGRTYTFSAWMRSSTAATTTTLTVAGQTVTQTTLNTWERKTITFVATSATVTATWNTSAAATIWIDDIQLELAATASTFSTVGPIYYARYTGYIERYPQTWVDAGVHGVKPLVAVDALSVLARTTIVQSYKATVLADNPAIYVPYNDAAAPQAVTRVSGGQPMIGYTQLGSNSGAVNFGGDQTLDGSPAVTIVQQQTQPATLFDNTQTTWLGTRQGALSIHPQTFTLELWLKPTAGMLYLGMAAMQAGETTAGLPYGTSKFIGWVTSAGGRTCMQFTDPNGTTTGPYAPTQLGLTWPGYPDGLWHQLVIVLHPTSGFRIYVDGQPSGDFLLGGTPSASIALDNIFAESSTYWGPPNSNMSLANLTAYPAELTAATILAHYQRGAGYLGEKSGVRVARLLTAYWGAAYSAPAGYVSLAPDFTYDGRPVLDCIQEIAATEFGFIYANGAGLVQFEDRSSREAQQASIATLGEGAGEIHYNEAEFDYDPTYVYSQTSLSRPGNSTPVVQTNATAMTRYGQRVLSGTLQVNTDWELQEMGSILLNRYAVPKVRVKKLTLSSPFSASDWSFILRLELGLRVTVKRRTSQGTIMSADYFVENISEHVATDPGSWSVELQLSPIFSPTTWILGDPVYGILGSTTIPGL